MRESLEQYITNIPDFPKPGVMFKDISPLLKHRLDLVVDSMQNLIKWDDIDYIAGIESRGFILASALGAKLGKGFIPIRKKGKLPPPVVGQKYSLEYGEDEIEMAPSKEKGKIVILDDVLATGGTMRAAKELCEKANYTVIDTLVLIDLKFLNTMQEEGFPVKSVLDYK